MTSKGIASRRRKLNSQIVREKDQKKMYELLFFFIILILISVPVLLYLWNRIEYVRYQYEITDLKQRKQILIRNEKYLETEKAMLESPRMIEEQARKDPSLKSQDGEGHLIIVRVQEEEKYGNSLLTKKRTVSDAEQMLENADKK
jgi:cell division protein FtsB